MTNENRAAEGTTLKGAIEALPIDWGSGNGNCLLRKDVLRIIEAHLKSDAERDSSQAERVREGITNIRNGLGQVRKELAADLGNIGAPAVSRTKKAMLNETMTELGLLISNCDSLLTEPKPVGQGGM